MNEPIVICDQQVLDAKLVPAYLLGKPGYCPAGVYETILVTERGFIHWESHCERLLKSCAFINVSEQECRTFLQFVPNALSELFSQRQPHSRFKVRLMVFGSEQHFSFESSNGVEVQSGRKENTRFLAIAWSVKTAADPLRFGCGISGFRRPVNDTSYNYKMLGKADADRELESARAKGFGDVLFFNDQDQLCEAAYSNVWLVIDGVLHTPSIESPCLPGITRQQIIEAARELDVSVGSDKPIRWEQLCRAEEIFLSSSIRGLQSVDFVEGIKSREIGDHPLLVPNLHEQMKR